MEEIQRRIKPKLSQTKELRPKTRDKDEFYAWTQKQFVASALFWCLIQLELSWTHGMV